VANCVMAGDTAKDEVLQLTLTLAATGCGAAVG